jgi:hypothetical protein
MKNLATFGLGQTPSQGTTTLSLPAQRVTISDTTNIQWARNVVLTNLGVQITRNNVSAAILYPDLIAALVTLEPTLTWPPAITVQPASVTVAYSASTSFTVVVNSELAVTYQWQVSSDSGTTWANQGNTGVYTGATTATLSISSASGLTGLQYRCVCTNLSGVTTTTAATLTVSDPLISVNPSNLSVTHPASASFTITASGATALSYQWQSSPDGVVWTNLTNAGVYSNTTTSTLNISDSTGLNATRYRCVVTDTAGTAFSAPATLTVA